MTNFFDQFVIVKGTKFNWSNATNYIIKQLVKMINCQWVQPKKLVILTNSFYSVFQHSLENVLTKPSENIITACNLKFLLFLSKQISGFPISCLHVAIVEFEDGLQYLQPLYDCCDECYFPDYSSCIWNGNPSWLCTSRAYKCICDCREAQLVELEDVTLKKSSFKVKSEKKVLTSASVCKKKSCSYGDKGCCVEDQCIKLYVHKTKSPVRQK